MARKTQIAEVRQALLSGHRFLLVSHQNPDGDAIGSCLALAAGLIALGKHCDILNADGVPMNLTWLPLAERVHLTPEGGVYDRVVLLDCGSADRTGFGEEIFQPDRVIVNIDHHPGNEHFGMANLVDPEACATAELVYDVLQALSAPIGYGAATAIYTGILTDTGCFRFSNTNARAFEVASRMVDKGVDAAWVAQMVFDQQPVARMRLLSRVLETLDLSPRDKAASVVVSLAMLRETHTGVEDVEGLVNYPRSICGVEVGLLFREEAP
ncbi:MAG: bifunctional oligoribonuclease/PAP phosphatase NrnA, partial [Proteobacteria bacterium]|nr:bifunctional oligoribonuclease/PAP phosphatase NrnA [Pseudomonadota bacterium]